MPLPIVRLVLICKAMDFAYKAMELQNTNQISIALQIKTRLTMGIPASVKVLIFICSI